jgi:Zn-dependent protease with chaperone function
MPFDKHSTFKAVFSDGKTARSYRLLATFGEGGLELFDEQEYPFAIWPYDQITSVEPLHPGVAAQLGHKEQPGARLYISRSDFAAELITRLPHISRKAVNRRVLVPLLITGFILAGVIGGIWLSGYSIPQAIAHMIPDKVRKGMGNQVIASLSGGRSACRGEAGRKALAKLVDRVGRASARPDLFDVRIMPLGMMNAFAAPGERIVVSEKLVKFVETPEELAGIIAHEMGHGIKMHPEAGIVRALGISAAINIAFGGSTGSFGDVGALLLQLKYSRSAEFEADTIALAILKKAEIPARPFASFFARLEEKHLGAVKQKTVKNKNSQGRDKKLARESGLEITMQLLSTHPSSPERIAVITKQSEWKTRPLLLENEWQALRTICDDRAD